MKKAYSTELSELDTSGLVLFQNTAFYVLNFGNQILATRVLQAQNSMSHKT